MEEKNILVIRNADIIGKYKTLCIRNKFFDEPVIVKTFEDRIEFTHPTIDYQGKVNKFTKRCNYYNLDLPINRIENFEVGKYLYKVESEDEIIIYLKEKLHE